MKDRIRAVNLEASARGGSAYTNDALTEKVKYLHGIRMRPSEIAGVLEIKPQSVYYHLNKAGLRSRGPDRTARKEETDPVPLTAPVDRDPCPRCGTRRDIGCRHSRAPLTMGAF